MAALQPTLFVETDLEPDDVVSLRIWTGRGYRLRYVVVGEGNVEMKVARARRYLQYLGENAAGCTIVAGHGGKNQAGFAAEGSEFGEALDTERLSLRQSLSDAGDRLRVERNYVSCLKAFVAEGGRRFVCMKPPRELCEIYGAASDETSCGAFGPSIYEAVRAALRQMKGFFYGSFNFRSVLFEEDRLSEERKKCLTRVLSAFERTVIYETFPALGLDNTMTKAKCPKTWAFIESGEGGPYCAALRRLVTFWNENIRNEARKMCVELLSAQSDQERPLRLEALVPLEKPGVITKLKEHDFKGDAERFWRYFRVYREYLNPEAVSSTIVLADVGLAVCAENPLFDSFLVKGRVYFDTCGYTQVAPAADEDRGGAVALYRNFQFPDASPFAVFDDAICTFLNAP